MSQQSKIIEDIQEIVMKILQNGSVTEEEGIAIDTLEETLYKQNAFKESQTTPNTTQGEEIATLCFEDKIDEGVKKLIEFNITPEDFFGFIEYHYDEEHPDEEKIVMFTEAFKADISNKYRENS